MAQSELAPLTVLGMISGTSVDGLDAAVVRIQEVGDTLHVRLLAYRETPFDEALRARVHALFDPARSRIDEVCEVNVLLGEAFAAAGAAALRDLVPVGAGSAPPEIEPSLGTPIDADATELEAEGGALWAGNPGAATVEGGAGAPGAPGGGSPGALAGSGAQPGGPIQIDLVASHGQTVWHQVAPGRTRSTLQLGEPSVIAERLGTTVIADFRPRDVAAGGEGAPLASYPDLLFFGAADRSRAVQNLGGIGNVTWLPAEAVGDRLGEPFAFDTGPGNVLIDHAVARLTGGAERFDRDGRLAAAGTVDEAVVAELLAHPYFARRPPKTTGRELFGAQFADPIIDRLLAQGRRPQDIVATLTDFTARSVADAYRRFLPAPPDEVIVGGGGARNPVLMARLEALLAPVPVVPHEAHGLPSTGREAIYFAILGYQALHGRPNTVPSCTGARHPVVMGKLVPGPNYRELAARVAAAADHPIRRARMEG